MGFGRDKKVAEPPVEPVAWADVHEFVLGSVERPKTAKRTRSGFGPRAIRVPQGDKDMQVLAPCAYVATAEKHSLPSEPALTLYKDFEQQHLLCYLDAPQDVKGERHHVVRDTRGHVIGTLRRVPPKRPFKHTWRIDQPDRPEIVGRNKMASGSAKEVAGRAAGRFVTGVFDDMLNPGQGDQPGSRYRPLEWRCGDEVVITSLGSTKINIYADWIDRRLAFAFALIGDK
ncbi:hypothetical protein OG210_21205 [Streptomyces sp. NBC_00466]|uniref:hypothetical protein n=1 Tax=Streptomyces sp. NBC_00466 TaxID=2903655 RepID=UPI0030E3FB9B